MMGNTTSAEVEWTFCTCASAHCLHKSWSCQSYRYFKQVSKIRSV